VHACVCVSRLSYLLTTSPHSKIFTLLIAITCCLATVARQLFKFDTIVMVAGQDCIWILLPNKSCHGLLIRRFQACAKSSSHILSSDQHITVSRTLWKLFSGSQIVLLHTMAPMYGRYFKSHFKVLNLQNSAPYTPSQYCGIHYKHIKLRMPNYAITFPQDCNQQEGPMYPSFSSPQELSM